MDKSEFLQEQFLTLRAEIKAIKARLFWIVGMGLFGIPVLTYLASDTSNLALLLVPYSVLVLIVLFLAEQNAMMRAGRFVREQIERHVESAPGWETWLESRSELRMMERHFFACFIVIFFVFYCTTIGMAIQRIMLIIATDPSGQGWVWLYGASATYTLGAIWAVSTLVHHWRSSIGTSTPANG